MRWIPLYLCAGALFLAGCSPAATSAPTAAPQAAKPAATQASSGAIKATLLDLNATPDPVSSHFQMSKELGLLEKNGLDATVKAAGGGGPEKIQALVAGQADAAISDIIAAFSATYEGSDVRALFVPSARYGWVISTQKKYTAIDQLKGQQVGVPSLGGSSRFGALLTFQHFGLTDKDIKWLAVGGTSEMLTALFAGRIEAGSISPMAVPVMKSQKNPDTHILIDNTARYTPPFPNFVAVASNKWVQDHPEAAQKVVATLLDEARLFSKDEAAWIKLASRYFPDVAQDELSSTWKSLTENGLWAVNGGVNFEATEGLMKSYFEVRGDKPNDKLSKGADVYNTGPLKAVLDQKGVIADSKDVPDWFKK